MKKILFFLLLCTNCIAAQTVAWERTATLGKGMNLSWLETWWNGNAANGYADYLDMTKISERKEDLMLMKALGISTIRLPICFDVWIEELPPYKIKMTEYFSAVDSILLWAEEQQQNVIIDYQHGRLSDDNLQEDTQRLIAVWQQIAHRFQDTDPATTFLELFNEPHDISNANWLLVVQFLIKEIRSILPDHTLIIGGVEYNGIKGLRAMPPLPDPNIIYTFHFYEPFLFTHQGADWVGAPSATLGIPFPFEDSKMPPMHPAATNTFGEDHYNWYYVEGQKDYLRLYLEAVKDWSLLYDAPVLCGEWGAHYLADQDSRCKHAATVLQYLQELNIPFCYWEWDRNFSFFAGPPSYTNLSDCMLEAWNMEIPKAPQNLPADLKLLIPNPFSNQLEVYFPDPAYFEKVMIYTRDGRFMDAFHLGGNSWIMDTTDWVSGLYFLHFEDRDNNTYHLEKVWKN